MFVVRVLINFTADVWVFLSFSMDHVNRMFSGGSIGVARVEY